VEKPKRPRKPIILKIKEPSREVIEQVYPREHDLGSCKTRIEYIPSEKFPDGNDESRNAQFWHDEYASIDSLTLQQLVDYAESKNIPLNKIVVSSIIPYGDADFTELELQITRKLSDEEMAEARESYDQSIAADNARLAIYEQAKADYHGLKVEWDLAQAQEAFDRLHK